MQDNGGDEMLSPFSSEVVSPVYNFSAQVKFETLISLRTISIDLIFLTAVNS